MRRVGRVSAHRDKGLISFGFWEGKKLLYGVGLLWGAGTVWPFVDRAGLTDMWRWRRGDGWAKVVEDHEPVYPKAEGKQ